MLKKISLLLFLIPQVLFAASTPDLSATPMSASAADTHEYVDLGLPSGTLWATCNVGATTPQGYGDLFAWGETSSKSLSSYTWASYSLCNGTSSSLKKYNSSDSKTTLENTDDAAYVNWGSNWSTPTLDQMTELVNSSYTTTTWTTISGVSGRKITSKKNGNSIFLPASGNAWSGALEHREEEGAYWTKSTYQNIYGRSLLFSSSSMTLTFYYYRVNGLAVRPVRSSASTPDSPETPMPDPEATTHEYVDLGLSSGTLWATCNVGAETVNDYGDYFAWGETQTKQDFNNNTYKWYVSGTITKYNNTDNLRELLPEHDAATQNWGSQWKMPTKTQWVELLNSCSIKRVNNANGSYDILTGPNGKTITLPAGGKKHSATYIEGKEKNACYWASTLSSTNSANKFISSPSEHYATWTDSRYYGLLIRPVFVLKKTNATSVVLSKTTLSLKAGETSILTANILPENASNKAVTWKSSNSDVAKVSADGVVTAVSAGQATITATSADGSNASASCAVTVTSGSTSGQNSYENIQWVDIRTGYDFDCILVKPYATNTIYYCWAFGCDENGNTTFGFTNCNRDGFRVDFPSRIANDVKCSYSPNDSYTDRVTCQTSDISGFYEKVTIDDEVWYYINLKDIVGDHTFRLTNIESGVNTSTIKLGLHDSNTTVKISSVEIAKKPSVITVGDVLQLDAKILPEGIEGKTIAWTSSDGKVANVSKSGVLKALSSGKVTIKADADGVNDNFSVYVVDTISENVEWTLIANASKTVEYNYIKYISGGQKVITNSNVYFYDSANNRTLTLSNTTNWTYGANLWIEGQSNTTTGWLLKSPEYLLVNPQDKHYVIDLKKITPTGTVKFEGNQASVNTSSVWVGRIKFEPCASPRISFDDGKIDFACDTQDADIHYTINVSEDFIKEGTIKEGSIPFTIMCKITAYATAPEHEQSEEVSINIPVCLGQTGDTNHDGFINISDIATLINKILEK